MYSERVCVVTEVALVMMFVNKFYCLCFSIDCVAAQLLCLDLRSPRYYIVVSPFVHVICIQCNWHLQNRCTLSIPVFRLRRTGRKVLAFTSQYIHGI